jgi:hypothetical protein
MRPYAVYLHERILVHTPKRGRQRELIMQFVRELGSAPFRNGDFQDLDDAGHELEIKIIGNYAITYWADHAAREVKVINVQSADKG